MKTMIYQFWDGEDKPGVLAGTELMREYADNIKSDYIFEMISNFFQKAVDIKNQ